MTLGLGDLIQVSEDEGNGDKPPAARAKRGGGLPPLDGPENVTDYVSKFKKTLLSKRQAHREVMERIEKERPKDAAYLAYNLNVICLRGYAKMKFLPCVAYSGRMCKPWRKR